jgi:HK97 family phage prohead protease
VTATHFRTYGSELELRKTGDGRTIFGIAVPYKKAMRLDDDTVEQFGDAPFADQMPAWRMGRDYHRVPFARDHLPLGGTLIGATKLLRDDAAGLYGEWRVAKSPAGDEALALWEVGALRELSVGFYERLNRILSNGVVERVRAHLFEVALVLEGAYGELATAQGVRSVQAVALDRPVGTPNLDAARALAASLPPLPSW